MDREELSWLDGGRAPVSVVERDCCESAAGESLRERCQAAGLDASYAVRHDHHRNRTWPVGHIHPGIKLVVPACRNPQLAAANGAVRHDVTAPGVMICAPALRAKSAR